VRCPRRVAISKHGLRLDRLCRRGHVLRLCADRLLRRNIDDRAGAHFAIVPIIAAGFGVILLGEPLTVVQIAGVALVIIVLIGATAQELAGTIG
jgi:hypothetical protein